MKPWHCWLVMSIASITSTYSLCHSLSLSLSLVVLTNSNPNSTTRTCGGIVCVRPRLVATCNSVNGSWLNSVSPSSTHTSSSRFSSTFVSRPSAMETRTRLGMRGPSPTFEWCRISQAYVSLALTLAHSLTLITNHVHCAPVGQERELQRGGNVPARECASASRHPGLLPHDRPVAARRSARHLAPVEPLVQVRLPSRGRGRVAGGLRDGEHRYVVASVAANHCSYPYVGQARASLDPRARDEGRTCTSAAVGVLAHRSIQVSCTSFTLCACGSPT